MKRAVIVGGFVTPERLLEPVGEALVEAGIVEDFLTFELKELIDDDTPLRRAGKGQLIVGHSAAPVVLTPEIKPEMLLAYNGPEPMRTAALVGKAVLKSFKDLGSGISGPHRRKHLEIFAANNRELLTDAKQNLGDWRLSRVKAIARFSTCKRLDAIAEANRFSFVKAIATDKDEFFKGSAVALPIGGRVGYQVIAGRHDELLVNPGEVLTQTFPEIS